MPMPITIVIGIFLSFKLVKFMQIAKNTNTSKIVQCKLYALVSLSIFSMLPGMAIADVYKCVVGKSTVYQNLPCAGEADAKPHVNNGNRAGLISNTVDVRTLSRVELAAAIKEADELSRRAMAAHEVAMYGLARNDYEGQRRVRDTYGVRWTDAVRRSKMLNEELKRRCPFGLSNDLQSCKDRNSRR